MSESNSDIPLNNGHPPHLLSVAPAKDSDILASGEQIPANERFDVRTDLHYVTSIVDHLLLSSIKGWQRRYFDPATSRERKMIKFAKKILQQIRTHPRYLNDPDRAITRSELEKRIADLAIHEAERLIPYKRPNADLRVLGTQILYIWFPKGIDRYRGEYIHAQYRPLLNARRYRSHFEHIADEWRKTVQMEEEHPPIENWEDYDLTSLNPRLRNLYPGFCREMNSVPLIDVPPEFVDYPSKFNQYIAACCVRSGYRIHWAREVLKAKSKNNDQAYPFGTTNRSDEDLFGGSPAADLIHKYSLNTNLDIRRDLEVFANARRLKTRCFGHSRRDGLHAPYSKTALDLR